MYQCIAAVRREQVRVEQVVAAEGHLKPNKHMSCRAVITSEAHFEFSRGGLAQMPAKTRRSASRGAAAISLTGCSPAAAMAGGSAQNRAASQTLSAAAVKRWHAGRLVSWQRWPACGQSYQLLNVPQSCSGFRVHLGSTLAWTSALHDEGLARLEGF